MARKPKLEIPVSEKPENIQYVTFSPVYDPPPHEYDHGSYKSYGYTVLYNGEEHMLFATEGLKNQIEEEGARKGSTVKVGRLGTGKSTRWYVSVENDGSDSISPPSKSAPAASSPGQYVPPDIEALKLIAADELEALKAITELVNDDEFFSDLSPERRSEIAVGALIRAQRTYRPGLQFAEELPSYDEEFLALARGANDGDAVQAVLQAILIMVEGYESRNEVITDLKDIGVSSTDITTNENTWLDVYHRVKKFKESKPEDGTISF